MDKDIIRADKKYRNKALGLLFLLGLLGTLLIIWGLPSGMEYLKRLDPKTAFLIIDLVLVFIMLSMIPIGLFLLKLSRKILKYECFPPPGMKVIKDTTIVKGQKAKVKGQILLFISILFMIAGLCGALYIHYLFQALIR